MHQPLSIVFGTPESRGPNGKPNGHGEDAQGWQRRPTILVVDDSPQDHELLKAASEEVGLDVSLRFANDAYEAQAYFEGRAPFDDRKKNPPPDLVLLDIQMPGMDGFELLAWIRSSSQAWRRVPVVVLSTSSRPEEMGRAYDLGANSYLVKPTEFDALCGLFGETVRYWVDRNRRA
jgi:CheY-like chemotaxis protein